MKYSKAKLFNRKASRKKNKPDLILSSLNLKTGMNILDLGSGGGYFTFHFAEKIGKTGTAYAVDLNQENIDYIKKQADAQKKDNIVTILTKEDEIPTPPEPVDLIFLRNVYHHIQNRVQYFKKIGKILRSNGKIAIIEYSKKEGIIDFHKPFGHYVIPEMVIEEMKEAGYIPIKQFDFLPEQSFTIFSLNK